uniref:Uncharacterized protein n=1 Tax=Anguilla anguilla TaxID=7936 RepID=A0A0E9UFD3_ANGAN
MWFRTNNPSKTCLLKILGFQFVFGTKTSIHKGSPSHD